MRFFYFSIVITISLTLASCKSELPDRQTLIDEYYEKKENEFLNQKRNNCKKEAVVEAQVVIDSLLDNWVNANLFDTLNFPKKPSKPQTPDHIIDKVSKFEVDKN